MLAWLPGRIADRLPTRERDERALIDPVNDATVRAVKSALEATYAAEAASGQ